MTKLLALAAAMAAVIGTGCDGGKTPKTEATPARGAAGVVLVSVDGLRPRETVVYGGAAEAPSLSRLAKSATVYEDVLSVSPMTRPATATLLTGLAPDRAKVRDDVVDQLPKDAATLAELFHGAGRTTAAFVTTTSASHRSGLERGFDVFDGPESAPLGPASRFPPIRPSSEATDHFAEWLVTVPKDGRFFAWIHLGEMRGPSADPQADSARKAYGEALQKIDRAVGRVLDAVEQQGWSDRTEIVFVGTGGDLLGEGDRWGSAYWLTDETLRVPLIWKRAASSATAARDARRVWLPDVPRTLASEIGASLHPSAEGEDLFGPAERDPNRLRRAWTWAPDDQAAWPTVAAVDAGAGLASFEGAEAKERPAVPRDRGIPPQARAAIEKAGIHLGGVAPPPLPSKKVRDESLVLLSRLDVAFAEGRFPRVGKHMDLLRKASPDGFATLLAEAFRAQMRQDPPGAREAADKLLARYPERREALHWAAHADLLDRKLARAEALLEAANAMGSADPDVLYDLACTRSLSGDAKRGLEYLGASIDAGFREWEWMEKDTDLTALRADPGFAALLRSHGR